MKILVLCWRDSTHPQGGGSERYAERVAQYLVQHGHQVVFRTAAHPGAPKTSLDKGIIYQRRGGKYTVYPRAWLAMMRGRCGLGLLKDIDVVIDTQNGIPFFGRVFSGKPTVLLTHHCHKEQWPVAGSVLAKVGWFIERVVAPWVYRKSTYVTVSLPSAAELVDLGVARDRIRIIRNGVDPVPAAVPTLECSGVHVVTLSRLVPHKRIEDAMDVVAALDGVTLDVLGSGWWESHLVDYAQRLGISDRVIFHGFVPQAYKHAVLERAVLQLMPSVKEGWGLAVIEAAQHGVPTVGYRSSGGLCDSIVDGITGVLVDSKAELVATTSRLLNDAATTAQLGANAAKRARAYSWEKTGAEFEQLLTQLSR